MRVLVPLLLLSSIAAADPDPKLLAAGRALEAKGKHAEAVAQFEAYLKAAPDDPVGNAELGLAAFNAKDLAKAEAATRRAIAHAKTGASSHDPDGRPRGAALFNLGMILEAQGKPKDAAVAYKDSLAAKPSRVVREKLQKLDPAMAAAADPLATKKLAGPFKDITELCRAWRTDNTMNPDETWGDGGSCGKPDPVKLVAGKLAAPFLEVKAFQLEFRENLEVAVRLADGWYHFVYDVGLDRGTAHCGGTDYSVKQLPMSATVPQLRLEYRSKGSCDHGGNGHSREWGWDETGIIAIGVGPSGKPSAPRVLVESDTEWERTDDMPKTVLKTVLKNAWSKDGALDISGTIRAEPTNPADNSTFTADDLLGHHILAFP